MNEDDKLTCWAICSDKDVSENEVLDGYIIFENEKTLQIQQEKPSPARPIMDHSELVVMAGLLDSHVHINEVGRAEWDVFYTATQAALAGGITTVIDMTLHCDSLTTSKDALNIKRAALDEQLHVDIGLWGGISSLQPGLSSVWTTCADYGISLGDVSRWLSWMPSIFSVLQGEKGRISLGYNADFIVWDPNEHFDSEPQDLRFRHKLSPYSGKHLKDRVHYTYLRGQLVYNNGLIVGMSFGTSHFI